MTGGETSATEVYHQPDIKTRMQELVRNQRIRLGIDYAKLELEPPVGYVPVETVTEILKEK